jgi:hypothetical protein
MRSWLARRRFVIVAALILAAVCLGIAEESFAHTDDGCPVETHCIACRLATGTVAVLASTTPVVQRTAERPERVCTRPLPLHLDSSSASTPSRAPPLA